MNFQRAYTIFLKEIRDVLRDRRTLMVMIVLPILLYPVVMILMSQIATTQIKKLETMPAKVAILGVTHSQKVVDQIVTIPALSLVSVDDPFLSVEVGEIQMVIDIPEGFDDTLNVSRTAGLTLYYDRANDHSDAVYRKVRDVLDSLETSLARERLLDREIDPEIVHPIEIESVNIASDTKMAAYAFGGIIALMLMLMALLGAFYPAIDLTAGEKERGTMETLLVSPASRLEIVFGKFLTVIVISIITAFLNLLSLGFTIGYILHMIAGETSLQLSISPVKLLIIFLLLLPLGVLFGSLCLAIASFSRSFKEGQNLLTPVQLLAVFLGSVVMIPGVEMTPAIAIIPVTNVVLLMKEILLGQAELPMAILVFVSIVVAAWIGVRWAVNQFQREDILFLEGDEIKWSSLLRRRSITDKPSVPGMGVAWFAYIFSLILLFYVGQPSQLSDITRGLLTTEILLVAGPPILLAWYFRYDLKRIFRLNIPKFSSVAWTILAAVSTWAIVVEVSALQNAIFPYPQTFLDAFEEIFRMFHTRGLVFSLAMMALLPAVCEEILFRGFILTGFQKNWGPAKSIIVTAVIFGLFHLSPYRYLPTTLLGILIGVVVIWTGSLWAGMLAHFVANMSSTVVFHVTYDTTNSTLIALKEGDYLPLWMVLAAVVILVISLWQLKRQYHNSKNAKEKTPPYNQLDSGVPPQTI